MADNYLEKKMADYRAGRAAGVSRRPGGLRLPPVTVLLDGLAPQFAAELCRVLTAAGYKVLATATTEIPQGAGARIYPDGITPSALVEDLEKRGEKLDCLISHAPSAFTSIALRRIYPVQAVTFHPGADEVVLAGGTPQQIALLAIALVKPDIGVVQQVIYLCKK